MANTSLKSPWPTPAQRAEYAAACRALAAEQLAADPPDTLSAAFNLELAAIYEHPPPED